MESCVEDKIKLKEGTARFEHFGKISPSLGVLFFRFLEELKKHGVDKVVVTSIIREQTNDSGIHSYGRGIDVAATFPAAVGEGISEMLNIEFPYDKKRPHLKSILFHKSKDYNDNGFHYHIQVRG